MAEQSLFIYISPEPLWNDQPQDVDHSQQAVIQGDNYTHYYHAIPTAFKGIEPYLALSSIPIITAAYLPPQANSPSHHPIRTDTTGARSGPSSSLPSSASSDKAEPPHSSTTSASNEQPHPRRTVPPPELKEDRIPRGKAEDMISWTDDDVDATDYKNMPDYDPNQETSEYDSTPPPETEAVASHILDDPSAGTSLVKRYVRIYSSAPSSSVEEVSGRVTLYLFESIPIVCKHDCKSPAPTLISVATSFCLLTSLIYRFLPHSQIPPTPLHPGAAQPPDSPFLAWRHTHNTEPARGFPRSPRPLSLPYLSRQLHKTYRLRT